MEVKEYADWEIKELERNEDFKWDEYAEEYRKSHTLEERMISMKPHYLRTEREEKIYVGLFERVRKKWESNPENLKKDLEQLRRIFRHNFIREKKEIFNGKDKRNPELRKIKITREAYEKAQRISERAVEISNFPNEIYMHFLNFKDKDDYVIRDVYIPNQKVDVNICRPVREVEGIERKEISDMGMRICGWSHSHGFIEPFHSSTDYKNLKYIPSTHGMKTILKLNTFSSELPYKSEVWHVPSIVFNAKRKDPSMKISIEYREYRDTEFKIHINESPELEIIDEDNRIETSDHFIDSEILKKVKPMGGFKKLREPEEKEPLRRKFGLNTSIEKEIRSLWKDIGKFGKKGYRMTNMEYLRLLIGISRQREKNSMLEKKVNFLESKVKKFLD